MLDNRAMGLLFVCLGPSPRSYRRAAVSVRQMQQDLHPTRPSPETRPRPHGRKTLAVRSLHEAIHFFLKPQNAHEASQVKTVTTTKKNNNNNNNKLQQN